MKKIFLLLLLAFIPIAPVKAQMINKNVFAPCVEKAISRPDAPKNIDKAMVSSVFNFEGKDYYLIDIHLTEEGQGWSFVTVLNGDRCEIVSDGFIDGADFVSLPSKLQVAWYEKLTLERIDEIGRDVIKQRIKSYTGPFQPYELKVYKKLGLLD